MEFPITINGVIFVALLIVPGVVLKRFYFQGEFTKQFGVGIFGDRLISSIFLGFLIQLVSFLTLGKYLNISIESIVNPVSIYFDALGKKALPNIPYSHVKYLFLYLLFNVIVAAILGTIAHKVVRVLRLDVIFHVLRFNNQWNYYFRGDILYSWDFNPPKKGKVLSTIVDIVMDVDHEGRKKMVSGILTEYTISSKTGELDLIYLTEAKRFSKSVIEVKESGSISKKEGMKDIPGDCMIIPYSKVIDLNLHYVLRETNLTKRKEVLNTIFALVAVVGTFFLMIFPWWLNLSFGRILGGILMSILGWILLLTSLNDLFIADKEKKLELGAKLFLGAMGLSSIWVVAKIYKFPLLDVLWSIIRKVIMSFS